MTQENKELLLVDLCTSNDGDKLDIPFEVFKQKPEIHIEVPYNSNKPCSISISCKRPENEIEVYGRLLGKIVRNARQKYIDILI